MAKNRIKIEINEDGPMMTIDGHDVEMRVTVSIVRSLRSKFGLDIPNIFNDASKLYTAIYGDPEQLCDIAYSIVAAQIPDVSADDFFELIGGSELAELRKAVEASILLFFDDPAKRLALGKMMDQMASAEKEVIGRVIEEVESLDRQEMIEEAMVAVKKEMDTSPPDGG